MVDNYFVIDGNESRRSLLCNLLRREGFVSSTNSISAIDGAMISGTWIILAGNIQDILDLFEHVQKMDRYFPVIFVGDEQPSGHSIGNIFHLGCVGVLELPIGHEEMRQSLSDIRKHSEGVVARRMLGASCLEKIRRLAKREDEVVRAICAGMTNKEAARSLSISHRTVEIHRANAMSKLEATTSAEMVRICTQAENYANAVCMSSRAPKVGTV